MRALAHALLMSWTAFSLISQSSPAQEDSSPKPDGAQVSVANTSNERQAVESKVLSVNSGKENIIVISQSDKRHFKLKDQVCVTRNDKEISCGEVISATKESATVKLLTTIPTARLAGKNKKLAAKRKKFLPKKGDAVVLRAPEGPPQNFHITVNVNNPTQKGESRKTASLDTSSATKPPEPPTTYIGVGIGAAFDYALPLAIFAFTLNRKVALGLSPVFVSSLQAGTKETAVGGFVTLSYHFTDVPFGGVFAEAGPGIYSISASNASQSQSGAEAAVLALLGWRGKIGEPLNLGLSAGLQYISQSSALSLLNFSGVEPLLRVDVGYSF